MKCRRTLHFIRVCNVCFDKIDLQGKRLNLFGNYNLRPFDIYNKLPQLYCFKTEGLIHLRLKSDRKAEEKKEDTHV